MLLQAVAGFADPIASGQAATPALSSPASVDLAREQRVALVGYRLASAARPLCDHPQIITGFVLHDIGGYRARDREGVERAYGLGQGFGIRLVVPDSAAGKAGLRADDVLIGLGSTDMEVADLSLIGEEASSARSDRARALIEDRLQNGAQTMEIRRNGQRLRLTMQPDRGCGGAFVVTPDRAVNAWSDGRGVAISARLLDLLDDDELAFGLGHEMAHNILGHAALRQGRSDMLTGLGLGTGRLKEAELDADGLGARIARTAGFAAGGAESFLRRIAALRGPALATTHPGFVRRIARLRENAAASGSGDGPR